MTQSSLHHAILRHIVDQGYAPRRAQLAPILGASLDEVTSGLRALSDGHGVVLHPHTPEVWVAHPFSTVATPFAVRQRGRMWWGNCAWCSLGVAALLGGDGVTIQTSFGAEGDPVTVHVDANMIGQNLWVHFPVPMTRAWDNVLYTCANMLLFRSLEEIDSWCARHAVPRGDAQPIQNVYDFARVWYGRHLDADWRKWTTDEAREIFTRFGLTGPIWELPVSAERF